MVLLLCRSGELTRFLWRSSLVSLCVMTFVDLTLGIEPCSNVSQSTPVKLTLNIDDDDDILRLPKCEQIFPAYSYYVLTFCAPEFEHVLQMAIYKDSFLIKSSTTQCVIAKSSIDEGQSIYAFNYKDVCKRERRFTCSFFGVVKPCKTCRNATIWKRPKKQPQSSFKLHNLLLIGLLPVAILVVLIGVVIFLYKNKTYIVKKADLEIVAPTPSTFVSGDIQRNPQLPSSMKIVTEKEPKTKRFVPSVPDEASTYEHGSQVDGTGSQVYGTGSQVDGTGSQVDGYLSEGYGPVSDDESRSESTALAM